VIGAAVMVGRIATGEITETKASAKSAAAELGSKGGKARAKVLTKAKRSEMICIALRRHDTCSPKVISRPAATRRVIPATGCVLQFAMDVHSAKKRCLSECNT